MICKYCGKELEEDARFCSTCGKVVVHEPEPANPSAESPMEIVAVSEVKDSAVEQERDARGKSILTYAILSLAFASSFYFAFVGIIFAVIAKVKVRQYVLVYRETRGTATVGKHLSLAGLISSIVLTAILAFVIFVAVGVALLESAL